MIKLCVASKLLVTVLRMGHEVRSCVKTFHQLSRIFDTRKSGPSVFRVSSNYQEQPTISRATTKTESREQQWNGMGPTLMCMLQSWKMRISGSMFVSSIWIWVWVCGELLPRFSHRITAQKEWAVRFGIGRIKLVVRIGPFHLIMR